MNTYAYRGVLLVLVAAMVLAVSGCADRAATTDAVKLAEQRAQEVRARVGALLESADASVTALVSDAEGLESKVQGLQISSDLKDIERRLTETSQQTGAEKSASIDSLSAALQELTDRIDAKAAEIRMGGPLVDDLTALSDRLKAVQADLQSAAKSLETSSAP